MKATNNPGFVHTLTFITLAKLNLEVLFGGLMKPQHKTIKLTKVKQSKKKVGYRLSASVCASASTSSISSSSENFGETCKLFPFFESSFIHEPKNV